MKKFKTTKGIEIHTNGADDWNVKELILGKVYKDGSFAKCIRIYNDENNIFQMQFLMGNDIAYKFLPECTELLDIMKDGLVGVSFRDLAEQLIEDGWTEVTGK